MKKYSLKIQYTVLTKTLQDFFNFRQAIIMENSSTPEHTKRRQCCNHPKRVTGNKHPALGVYCKTLKNSLQLQLCNNSFGAYCQLDQILDPTEVSGVTPKSLLFT